MTQVTTNTDSVFLPKQTTHQERLSGLIAHKLPEPEEQINLLLKDSEHLRVIVAAQHQIFQHPQNDIAASSVPLPNQNLYRIVNGSV